MINVRLFTHALFYTLPSDSSDCFDVPTYANQQGQEFGKGYVSSRRVVMLLVTHASRFCTSSMWC